MRYLSMLCVGLYLTACSTVPTPSAVPATASTTKSPSFTSESVSENMMKIHPGMSSDEILKMFGKPRSVRQSVCGGAAERTWVCTTWDYGEFGTDRASFTFSGETADKLILNDFDIDRKAKGLTE
jgi:hypothetical protein